jgi:hypothetical protein
VFLFIVADLNKARAFISARGAAETGSKSCVLAGDYWFVE